MRQKVPVIADLKPSGKYVATDLHKAGGIPQIMKMLRRHGIAPSAHDFILWLAAQGK